ncbi:hypothetical protein llap_13213 [Limosa lapponica baueri]|uniref:Uncharacterized protein n=1 Tax=Limosa lapponica baueri TaxID=1758121 RepID=A0A2I0TRP2_LIMLA|nr:hypothetical protein llap_13213 [Limosa lapponica baueri]
MGNGSVSMAPQGKHPVLGQTHIARWTAMDRASCEAAMLPGAVGASVHGLGRPPPRSTIPNGRGHQLHQWKLVRLGPVLGAKATELSIKESNSEGSIFNDLNEGQ